MATVADIYGRLLLDDKAFDQQVNAAASRAGDKLGTSVGSRMGAGLATNLRRVLDGTGGPVITASGAFGKLKGAITGVGGALGFAAGRIKSLILGPLGFIGLGAGLLTISGFLKASIGEARDFGGEVKRLAALTGLSTETTSKLAGAFQHFGIDADTAATIVGRVEKNLGVLTATTTRGAASADQLRKAHDAVTKAEERLAVARLKLNETEAKGSASASSLLAARNRVADATRSLSDAEGRLATLQGKSGVTTSKAAEFTAKYGLSLTDAKGKAKDFNTLLLDTADFWNNKAIPAQTKAAALNALYGKTWQELIPLLGSGRAGIQAAEEEAARLGLTLGDKDLNALTALKAATRTWTDALAGLKLQIGLAVIPVLTEFTKGLTTLVVDNRQRLVGFVRDVAQGALGLARAFGTYVLPALQSVGKIIGTLFSAGGGVSFVGILVDSANFAKDLGNVLKNFVAPGIQAIVSAWNGLPSGLRELLIKGFIANKVVKWTFGFDAIGFGKEFAGSFISNLGGKVGGQLLNKVLAQDVIIVAFSPVAIAQMRGGGGGLPQLPPGILGAAGGAGGLFGAGGILGTGVTLAGLFAIAAPIALAAVITELAHQPGTVPNAAQSPMLTPPGGTGGGYTGGMPYGSANNPAHVVTTQSNQDQRAAQQGMGALGNAMQDQARATQAQTTDIERRNAAEHADDQQLIGATRAIRPPLDALHRDFMTQLTALKKATTPADIARAADRLARDVVRGVGNAANTKGLLAELKKKRQVALEAQDKAALRVIDAAIRKVEAKIPGREWVQRQLHAADRILHSNQTTAQKVAQLHTIENQLKAHGDIHAARIVARLISLQGTVAALAPRLSASIAAQINARSTPGQVRPGSHQFGGLSPAFSPFIAGEVGPELVMPEVPSYTLTARTLQTISRAIFGSLRSAGSAGGDTYNIPISVQGLVRAETPADIVRPLRQIASLGYIRRRPRLTFSPNG